MTDKKNQLLEDVKDAFNQFELATMEVAKHIELETDDDEEMMMGLHNTICHNMRVMVVGYDNLKALDVKHEVLGKIEELFD